MVGKLEKKRKKDVKTGKEEKKKEKSIFVPLKFD